VPARPVFSRKFRDPEKLRINRRRHYERHRELTKQKVLVRKLARRADLAKVEADRLWRREHKRKLREAALASGLTSAGKIRKVRRLSKHEQFEREQDRMMVDNAKQAWQWWIGHLAPEQWLDSYWQSHPKPWNDPRLTLTQSLGVRYRIDPRYALKSRVRNWMNKVLRGKKCGRRWADILGYSIDQLHAHLEQRFLPGMSWSNMGDWHIDHIKPVNTFSFSCETDVDFIACYALSNLRPLWAIDNWSRPKDGSDLRHKFV